MKQKLWETIEIETVANFYISPSLICFFFHDSFVILTEKSFFKRKVFGLPLNISPKYATFIFLSGYNQHTYKFV